MSDKAQSVKLWVEQALVNEQRLEELCEALSGASRRARQTAAAALSVIARKEPQKIAPHMDELVDALNRPEAQTRWECLDALTALIDMDSRTCDRAIPGAETSLFDEESGPARLSAMKFLCKLGSTTENRSEKTWPLIDEGIQCYHGDLEFQDMLVAVVEFSTGKLSSGVKEKLAARMSFDAVNGRGVLKRRAQQILDNVKTA